MTRNLLVLALSAIAGHAAVIRGMVVENQTSKALMRATVVIQPLPGTSGRAQSARTNRTGGFDFDSLAAGAYILRASRRGFMSAEYGQKRWNSAGTPIVVEQDTSLVLNIRLPRFGSITGTVKDENEVGIADYDVLAYRNTQPPRLAARARSDERGVYRLTGLEPGLYLVRSGALQDEEIGYLPTFSPQSAQLSGARPVPVYMEEESRNADVQPVIGRLFTVSGRVVSGFLSAGVTITLSSELGRQTVSSTEFQFGPLPPGDYELFAEAPVSPLRGSLQSGVMQAGYMQLKLSQNLSNVVLQLQPVSGTVVDFSPDLGPQEVMARRRDLAGAGEPQQLRIATGSRAQFAPGRWELKMTPPPGYYVSGFSGASRPVRPTRADGWNETAIGGYSRLSFTLAGGPAGIHGVVKSNGDPVPGAPVFLEGYDPVERRPVTEVRAIRADMRGTYHFDDLTPGTYRILASFEYQTPDAEALDYNSRTVEAQAKTELPLDLDLFVIR